ncbi:MAG: hypothetical protein ACM3ZT_04690 [Bacillota bacterium]
MRGLNPKSGRPAPLHPEPLAQVEVLLLFDPTLQTGGAGRVPPEACASASQGWLTLDVYGNRGISEIAGRPIMENLRLETHGEDIEALLPDGIVNDVADYVLGEE